MTLSKRIGLRDMQTVSEKGRIRRLPEIPRQRASMSH